MFWFLLLTLGYSFTILPFNQNTKPNFKYLAYQSGSNHIETVPTLSQINLPHLFKYGVIKISTQSVIFSEELAYNTMTNSYRPTYEKQKDYKKLNHNKHKYYQVDYSHAKLTREITHWKPIGKCIVNKSTETATYSQGWQIDYGSSLNFKIDFATLIIGLRPNTRSELVLTKSIGGGLSCDVDPGKSLQFALISELYQVTGVKQREIKITPWGLKPGDWEQVPPFSRLNKRNIQVGCFTDDRFSTCGQD